MKEQLIIIGNGMAPGRLLERLLEQDSARYQITIYNAEPRVNYNRLMLSPVLSGDKRYEDIITHDDAWYEQHGITLHKGVRVGRIDRDHRRVFPLNGDPQHYDRLIIATGSDPIWIPLPGHKLPGVQVYRDLDDVDKMLACARQHQRAVVIGGGLLGLEAAAGLRAQGMDVTVLHKADTLMERQLDETAGFLLETAMIERGITVITGADTEQILGADSVTGVRLGDGIEIDADLVVMAVGIRPSLSIAHDAGLAVNRGILVNDQLRTSDPDVFALGECVEHGDTCYGLVAPLYEMANVLASTLLEQPARYQGSVTSTKLKVSGVDLFSAGDFSDAPDREEIVLRDAAAGVYKRLVLQNNEIVGVVMYGETTDGPWFFDLLKRQVDVTDMRDTLIFGQAYQGGWLWTLRRPLQPCPMRQRYADATACANQPSSTR